MIPQLGPPSSEVVEVRLRRCESWWRKSRKAGSAAPPDLDAQFVFLWIAFSALYGRPRYRGDFDSAEIDDFKKFLVTVEDLSRAEVATALRHPDLEKHVERLLHNPFLNVECWKRWDMARPPIRNRQQRIDAARYVYDKEHPTASVFLRLYTLRNQLLHGAATDAGRRNRESLRQAIPVLDTAVKTLIGLVRKHHAKIPALEPLPYPPSIGEAAPFNGLRIQT